MAARPSAPTTSSAGRAVLVLGLAGLTGACALVNPPARGERLWRRELSLGDEALHRGLEDAAAAHYARASQAARSAQAHDALAQSLNAQAALARLAGRYARAAEFYRQSAAALENAAPVPAAELSAAVYNLAQSLSLAGRSEEAAEAYRKLAGLSEAGLDPGTRSAELSGAGQFFHARRQFDEALGLYRRALALAESRAGADPAALAGLRADIASAEAEKARSGAEKP